MIRRSFHALLVDRSTIDLARSLDGANQPLILLSNHIGWWDPLVILELRRVLWPSRVGIAPMDAAQLRRFRFMRKLGLFGIDPDDPRSLDAMIEYVSSTLTTMHKPSFCITPQGRFTDVREPIRLRPGAAAIAAHIPEAMVVVLSLEYVFWQDRRPEIAARFERVDAPSPGDSTTAWQRVLTAAMQRSAESLRTLVIHRQPEAFVNLLRSSGPRVNPVYDAWLRWRGAGGEIDPVRNAPTSKPHHSSSPASSASV